MRPIIVILICIVLLSGCTSLIIRDDDNVAVVTGKVAVRTINCVLTIFMGCASEWIWMDEAKSQSLVWYGRGDINQDDYQCRRENSYVSQGQTAYYSMPMGKGIYTMPLSGGEGQQLNWNLYSSCMRSRGYQLVDRYDLEKFSNQTLSNQKPNWVRDTFGTNCAVPNATVGTKITLPSGKMASVTAVYGASPRCQDPAVPILVDVREIDEKDSQPTQGSNCAGSATKVGTKLKLPNGKSASVTTVYGTSPRCQNPALPILVDVREIED